MEAKKSKRGIWRGLTTASTSFLALAVSASMIIDSFRTDIDKFLGTQSTKMVTENQSEEDYRFKSDYSSTTELLEAIQDLGERMSEEGTVLLKNNGGCLFRKKKHRKYPFLGLQAIIRCRAGTEGVTFRKMKGQTRIR